MNKPLLVLLLLSSLAVDSTYADGEWTQFHGGPTHNNARSGKLKIKNPNVAWHVVGTFGQPTVSGDDIYSGGKGLFRIHAVTGEVLAKVDVPMEGDKPAYYYSGAPIITESSVIARRNGGVEARSRDLSKVLWETKIPGASKKAYAHPATLFEGTVLLTQGSDLLAIDATTGEVDWQLSLGSGSNMVPAAASGHVFVGAGDGRFLSINIETGTEAWSYEGEGQFGHTSPVFVDGMVVVGDRGVSGGRRGAVIALDAKTGQKKWETGFGATGLSTPGVTKGAVFAGFGKTVGFFNLKDGKLQSKPRIRCGANAFGSPTIIGKHLLYGHLDGNLYVHDAKSGKIEWQFRVPDAQVSDFVHAHERLYVGTTKGLVALQNAKGSMKGNVLVWSPDETE